MKIAAVIFDWAGTMVDFGCLAPVVAMRRAMKAEDVVVDDGDIRAGMGLAKRDHVANLLGRPSVSDAWRLAHGRNADDRDVDRVYRAVEPLMLEEGAAHATLIPGAGEAVDALRAVGAKIGSSTGYTRAMMTPIAASAARQGYAPDVIVCAGETPRGRPSPFMLWKALIELDVWSIKEVIKIDDAPVGIEEGKNAGCYTIGIAASGNGVGLSLAEFSSLTGAERSRRVEFARNSLRSAGADLVIDTVADLPAVIRTLC